MNAGSRPRTVAAAETTLVVLTGAVTAGLLSPPDGRAPVICVARISSQISQFASGPLGSLWWVYAFLLGVVAAFNPCGFALLPAYLGLYLNHDKTRVSFATRARRALAVSVVVAGAFTVLFGVTGSLYSVGSSVIVRLLPWIGLGVGCCVHHRRGCDPLRQVALAPRRRRAGRRTGRGGCVSHRSGVAHYVARY